MAEANPPTPDFETRASIIFAELEFHIQACPECTPQALFQHELFRRASLETLTRQLRDSYNRGSQDTYEKCPLPGCPLKQGSSTHEYSDSP